MKSHRRFGYIPYVPVSESRNSGICGVANVNTTNSTPIKHIMPRANRDRLHRRLSFLKTEVSKIKAIASDTKNIAILSQSGDLPNAPL